MPHFTISLTVDVEDDTLTGAVEQGREDIARYARRGTLAVRNNDNKTTFQVAASGDILFVGKETA